MLKNDQKWLDILKIGLPILGNHELGGITIKGQVEDGLCILGVYSEPEITCQDPSFDIYTGVTFKTIAVMNGWLDELKKYIANNEELAKRQFGDDYFKMIHDATDEPEHYYPMFNRDIEYQAETGNIDITEEEIVKINDKLMADDNFWDNLNSYITDEISGILD